MKQQTEKNCCFLYRVKKIEKDHQKWEEECPKIKEAIEMASE